MNALIKYATEGIGTFFLVLTICLSGHPLAVGIIFMALIYIGKSISGGHYNPATTCIVWLGKGISLVDTVGYVVGQLVGAFIAAGLFNILSERTFYPIPSAEISLWQLMLVELLFSFIFFMVILVVQDAKSGLEQLDGIIIGFTLFALMLTLGSITGSTFNPAVAIGTSLFDLVRGGGFGLRHIPLYTLAPIAGAALAFITHKTVLNQR
ncbi:MAG: aquaporin [Candidatus Babeliales bacterium]